MFCQTKRKHIKLIVSHSQQCKKTNTEIYSMFVFFLLMLFEAYFIIFLPSDHAPPTFSPTTL